MNDDFLRAAKLVCSRDVELVLRPAVPPYTLCIHAGYDGYGDFFQILAQGVRHVEFTSGMLVSELVWADSVRGVLERFPRWAALGEEFVENAILLIAQDHDGERTCGALAAGILVAETLVIKPGAGGWPRD
ncbi:MAG: hypothetical protein U0414_32375 [Polyangiaceae bacterium]